MRVVTNEGNKSGYSLVQIPMLCVYLVPESEFLLFASQVLYGSLPSLEALARGMYRL